MIFIKQKIERKMPKNADEIGVDKIDHNCYDNNRNIC